MTMTLNATHSGTLPYIKTSIHPVNYSGNSEFNNSYTNKPSGAEGWEDRSYGNSSENSEYESGRSRRKRGASNDGNLSKEDN